MKKILIVEDTADNFFMLQSLLSLNGVAVLGAGNGEEGLQILQRENDIDGIILDIMMPVMDGWTFLGIKEADPKFQPIPVLVSSASFSREFFFEKVKFLPKPINFLLLLEWVNGL